jgi:16S rRNA (cytosine1402-N4)-methyltransferase
LRATTCAPTRCSSTSASPRCRSTGRSAASPTRPTRRSTCGWIRLTSRAAGVVATYDERELETIFRRYGEERYARQIARGIVRRRAEEPIERTGQLVDVVRASIPAPARFGEGHPAKRVFQALRIEVNHELESLEIGLPAAFEMLRPGGRLAVISFHSLEDRIVKRFLRDRAKGCTCPPELPVCVCGKEPDARILTPKPVRPSAHEIDDNPRASSARLRAAVRV